MDIRATLVVWKVNSAVCPVPGPNGVGVLHTAELKLPLDADRTPAVGAAGAEAVVLNVLADGDEAEVPFRVGDRFDLVLTPAAEPDPHVVTG